ncbi:MAG: hypothetical protein AB1515_04455 [Nitrospirota bacterium]
MIYIITQIMVKALLSLLFAWGIYRAWPSKRSIGNVFAWVVIAVPVFWVIIVLLQKDIDVSRLLSVPDRLKQSAEETLSLVPQRDPDALYQDGELAARVEGAGGNLDAGTVSFKMITQAEHIDLGREVEYLAWRLRCPLFDTESNVVMGGVRMRSFSNVRCEVVGQRALF